MKEEEEEEKMPCSHINIHRIYWFSQCNAIDVVEVLLLSNKRAAYSINWSS